MMNDRVLVCEISGKRPGGLKARPTEYIKTAYDHLIVTNNCDAYETDWDIVEVPEDYRKWYFDNIKNSENMWYAQMNRSYAIKYAKEHGYRYCIQLDDNIRMFGIGYIFKLFKDSNLDITKEYRRYKMLSSGGCEWFDDIAGLLVKVLENTNAGMAGVNLCSAAAPSDEYLKERYVYSVLCIDVKRCPQFFHGDFEDDIEFRLKLKQMGVPVIQLAFLGYSKVGAREIKDKTGCRAEYDRIGIGRGEHMRKLYGDLYSCGMSRRPRSVGGHRLGKEMFRHQLKPFKIGVMVKRKWQIDDAVRGLLEKYAINRKPSIVISKGGKRIYKRGGGTINEEDGPTEDTD